MRFKRVRLPEKTTSVAAFFEERWWPLAPFEGELGGAARDLIQALAGGPPLFEKIEGLLKAADRPAPFDPAPLLPFSPRTFRDFMLYEAHVVGATKGWLRRFAPRAYRAVQLYERVFGRPHPKVRPKPLWYRRPIYYMGNPLSFLTEGEEVPWPGYTRALDFELELGFVIARPLGKDPSPEEAARAIGGFFVLNDFSARDVQAAEMQSGFGPVKAKNFATGIGAEVVSADEVLPRWQHLSGEVRINDEAVCRGSAEGPRFDLGEAVAYAALGEGLVPGEAMATGTFPGCSGLEAGRLLAPGDRVEVRIEGVGTLKNPVGSPS